MKKEAIVDMVIRQYGWDHRAVEVSLDSVVDDEFTFNVCHDHPYDNNPPINLKVTVKIEVI